MRSVLLLVVACRADMLRRLVPGLRRASAKTMSTKPKCVMLNAARLDFDGRIDFAKLEQVVDIERFDKTQPEDVAARCEGAQILVNKEMPLTAETIASLPSSVKLICEAGTGYNNVDLDACQAKGVSLSNVPTYATEAMAHMAITSLMACSCSLWQQAAAFGCGDFQYLEQCHPGSLTHVELHGKTLGLVGGLGTIGKRVASIASALGMKVVASSSRMAAIGQQNGMEVVSLDELLETSDFVSIHCPLNANTKGLIGRVELAKMKPTAFLINTARGSIIDQDALVEALSSKTIAGAALDVFGEGSAPPPALPANHPLYSLDNVMLTPHIGWQRLESRQRVVDMVADNCLSFLNDGSSNIDLGTGLPRKK